MKLKRAVRNVLEHPPEDADVYVQDGAEVALHPALRCMWMKRSCRQQRQREISALGSSKKRHVFADTDWCEGIVLRCYNDSRDSVTFCALADDCVARSCAQFLRS